MRKLVLLVGILSSCFALATAQAPANSMIPTPCAKPMVPGHDWKRAPRVASNEWSSPKLAIARQYADSLHDSSVVIVQCGRLVDEWGDPSKKITTFSVRKSFISALYGIYSAEGKIDVTKRWSRRALMTPPRH